jgi:hypothetical protein
MATITFNQSGDLVIVDNYAEGSPADFDALWTADISAINGYRLLNGTIDASPDTFSLDTQPRPADSKAVLIKISCTARAGATCDISGTDAWGNAISETGIDISSGSATTTNRFATVDASGVTVTGLTNGDDFDLYQDRWGWISKDRDSYVIEGRLMIGGGTNATYFTDKLKLVNFKSTYNGIVWYVSANASAIFGDYTNSRPSDGCVFKFYSDSSNLQNNLYTAAASSTFKAYACTFLADSYSRYLNTLAGTVEYNNCLFVGMRSVQGGANCSIIDSAVTWGRFAIENSGTNDTIIINNSYSGIIFRETKTTYRGISANVNNYAVYFQGYAGTLNLIDCEFNNWDINWVHAAEKTGSVNRQASFNLLVQDTSGNPIEGASVVLADKDGTELFSGTTDSNGEITEQIVTYQKYTKNGTANATITTTYSPHTITISKSGYITKTVKLTMDRKREEVETLEPQVNFITLGGQEVIHNADPTDGQNRDRWVKI